MRLARVLMLAPALAALIGCTEDKTRNATWRHSDGSPLDAVELAQSRAACDRTATRADLQPPPAIASNPAYHPGGIGLESSQARASFAARESEPSANERAGGAGAEEREAGLRRQRREHRRCCAFAGRREEDLSSARREHLCRSLVNLYLTDSRDGERKHR